MSLALHPMLRPYLGKPAIVDSNLVLLDWRARYDPTIVGKFKRLSGFRSEDAMLLASTLKLFSGLYITPHVLTEVSNLANSLPEWRKAGWISHFSKQIQVVPELWTSASSIAGSPYLRLGITDAILASLASTHVIVTIDFPSSGSLQSQSLNVINFTSLRNSLL